MTVTTSVHTFPEASGDAFFWSRRLATSIFPYFAATCSGVNPFCKKKQLYSRLVQLCSGQSFLWTTRILLFPSIPSHSPDYRLQVCSFLAALAGLEAFACKAKPHLHCNNCKKGRVSSFLHTTKTQGQGWVMAYLLPTRISALHSFHSEKMHVWSLGYITHLTLR